MGSRGIRPHQLCPRLIEESQGFNFFIYTMTGKEDRLDLRSVLSYGSTVFQTPDIQMRQNKVSSLIHLHKVRIVWSCFFFKNDENSSTGSVIMSERRWRHKKDECYPLKNTGLGHTCCLSGCHLINSGLDFLIFKWETKILHKTTGRKYPIKWLKCTAIYRQNAI